MPIEIFVQKCNKNKIVLIDSIVDVINNHKVDVNEKLNRLFPSVCKAH